MCLFAAWGETLLRSPVSFCLNQKAQRGNTCRFSPRTGWQGSGEHLPKGVDNRTDEFVSSVVVFVSVLKKWSPVNKKICLLFFSTVFVRFVSEGREEMIFIHLVFRHACCVLRGSSVSLLLKKNGKLMIFE